MFEDSLEYRRQTFALAVSHTPWRADRVENLERMRPILMKTHHLAHRVFDEKAPNWKWSRDMWGWGVSQSVTHTVYVQDDLELAEDFWPMVKAMVAANPNNVIALLSNHPFAVRAAAAGHNWYKCCEVLGAAYVFPTAMMGAFLEWRDTRTEGIIKSTNEDAMMTNWLWFTERRAWNPIPAPVQSKNDVIDSTNPREGGYLFRASYVFAGKGFNYRPLDWINQAYWEIRPHVEDYGYSVSRSTPDMRDGWPQGPPVEGSVKRAHDVYVNGLGGEERKKYNV
jgi:hypothetical protein